MHTATNDRKEKIAVLQGLIAGTIDPTEYREQQKVTWIITMYGYFNPETETLLTTTEFEAWKERISHPIYIIPDNGRCPRITQFLRDREITTVVDK